MAYKNFKATEIIEEIGAELRKIRISHNHTLRFVADELARSGLHISTTLLGRIENGERRIDDNTLNAICSFYDVDPGVLIISAAREHIRRLSDNHSSSDNDDHKTLIELYQNLNQEGQKEVTNLMRLMAYMEAFKIRS